MEPPNMEGNEARHAFDSVLKELKTNLNETKICLAGDVNCYIPIGIVNENTTTGEDTKVKCLMDWCYIVSEAITTGP